MPTFQVKRELAATRCDICHQSDLFDTDSGRCGRCDGVIIPKVAPPPVRTGRMPWWERIFWLSGWRGMAVAGLVFIFLLLGMRFFQSAMDVEVRSRDETQPQPVLEVLPPGAIHPEFRVGKGGRVEIRGLLSERERERGVQLNAISGIPVGTVQNTKFQSVAGLKFEVRVGRQNYVCFLPRSERLSPNEQARIHDLLLKNCWVTIDGRCDSWERVIVLDRLVIQPGENGASKKAPPVHPEISFQF